MAMEKVNPWISMLIDASFVAIRTYLKLSCNELTRNVSETYIPPSRVQNSGLSSL